MAKRKSAVDLPAHPQKLTADEVFKLVKQLPPGEAGRLVYLINQDGTTYVAKQILLLQQQRKMYRDGMKRAYAKLERHRKPKRNEDRDDKIILLWAEGKSDGQIKLALRGEYPTLEKGQIRAVIL